MAGLGGGTADAAAIIQSLCVINNIERPMPQNLLELGADVPVSFYGSSAIMRGIGEDITPFYHQETLHLVLVNPMIHVLTKAIFASPKLQFSEDINGEGFDEIWRVTGNDMQDAAIEIAPEIADVIANLKHVGATHIRMSGSGATVFSWSKTKEEAEILAEKIKAKHPHYWVQYACVRPSAKPPYHKAI